MLENKLLRSITINGCFLQLLSFVTELPRTLIQHFILFQPLEEKTNDLQLVRRISVDFSLYSRLQLSQTVDCLVSSVDFLSIRCLKNSSFSRLLLVLGIPVDLQQWGSRLFSASVDSLAGSRLCEIWATYWIEFGPNKSTALCVSRLFLHRLIQSVEYSVG